jgi:SAM-dependent MidA family methyltransferase
MRGTLPGFYGSSRGPGTDFRTATTLAPDVLAEALAALLDRLPPGADHCVVEIGAGTGALLAALADRLPERVALLGVEQRPRPNGLPERVRWTTDPPSRFCGLLLAVEWLDTVPVDVVVDGRTVLVGPDGVESVGPPPGRGDLRWLSRWWPAGQRREIGSRRDEAWAGAVRRLERGVALSVDYGHDRATRPEAGSLGAYRAGRPVAAVPDGDRDVTAAVAWDACAAAVRQTLPALAADATRLTDQRSALQDLGVTGALPQAETAGADPRGYLVGLQRSARAARLLDPDTFGAFGWLMHAIDVPPAVLPGCTT